MREEVLSSLFCCKNWNKKFYLARSAAVAGRFLTLSSLYSSLWSTVGIVMRYLLKYSMLKPGLRLAAWEGDASKAGRRKTAFSGDGIAADREGSRMTALCGCRR